MKSLFRFFVFCIILAVFCVSCDYSKMHSLDILRDNELIYEEDNSNFETQSTNKFEMFEKFEESKLDVQSSGGFETIPRNESEEIYISIYSLSVYNELYSASEYTDKELDAFLYAYPECLALSGIANREDLILFVKLLETAPIPTVKDETLVESFYLEYREGQNMFDVIYKVDGQRYRFCVWPKNDMLSGDILADTNVQIVSTHMIGDVEIGLYNKGSKDIYYDSFELSNHTVEVIAYDDTGSVLFDFSNFYID